jgi:hypothetical protein
MRRSEHSTDLREFEVTSRGLRILDPFRDHEGVLTGIARPSARSQKQGSPGLTAQEQSVLRLLQQTEQTTEEALRVAAGLSEHELGTVVGRLIQLNYVLQSQQNGQTLYRAIERPLRSRE